MTAGFRVREQKFICGKDYATADTMQVDFFEITEQQHKASTRKKKELASSIAKEAYNLRKSGRYLELLVQRNFHKSDYSVTYTYDDEHRPDPADAKRFLLRVFWKRGAGVMPDAEAERQARHRQG